MMFATHRMNARPITAGHRNLPLTTLRPATGYTPEARIYNLAVVRVPVPEPAGARTILTLERYVPALNYLIREATSTTTAGRQDLPRPSPVASFSETRTQAIENGECRLPFRLTCPFILRTCLGETLRLRVTNYVEKVPLALTLADDDYGLDRSDRTQGSARTFEFRRYLWHGIHEGVFPIYNSACGEASTRRQLLGVLIVEP